MANSDQSRSNADEYHRLLYRNQRRIYAYVLRCVGNYSDSDDIMQDTISIMWRKFSDFEPGSDFVAWGRKIAHFRILEYRRQMQKCGIVQYTDEIFEELASQVSPAKDELDDRSEILKKCLKKLKEKYFTVVKLRYYEDSTPKEIAGRIGLSVSNVYQILSRAHGYLMTCMKNSYSIRER